MIRSHMERSTSPRAIPDGYVPGSSVSRDAGADTLVRFAPATWNADARTIEAVLSTGAPVTRWGITEQLDMTPAAIDLSRVAGGQVKLLDSHDQSTLEAALGLLDSVRFEGAALVGVLRFAESDRGRAAAAAVAAGVITGISIGYRVLAWTMTATDPVSGIETWTATRWELLEVSLVTVPADPLARVRSADTITRAPAQAEGDADMRRNLDPSATPQPAVVPSPVPAVPTIVPADPTRAVVPAAPPQPVPDVAAIRAAEVARISEIQTLARSARMVNADGSFDDVVDEAIRSNLSVNDFRARAFDALASRAATHPTSPTRVTRDEGDTRRREFTDAIFFGIRGSGRIAEDVAGINALSEGARRMMGHTISEIGAAFVGERHLPRSPAEHDDVLRRAFHSTSDFPVLLANGLNRVLAAQYQAAAPTYRQIANAMTFSDFRAHEVLRAGDFPMLQKVLDSGEIKAGTFGEKKESLTVLSYGIQVPFSRQLLINDRLGAINQMLASYGTTIALFEEITFYAMLTSGTGSNGPTLVEDSAQVFATAHGNLTTGATGVIDNDKLSTGRTALRKMKRLDGNYMSVAPSIILAGPDRETEIDRLLTPVQATQATNINTFAGKLKPVITAQLGALPWYLFADPGLLETFRYGLLDGFTGPRMRIDEPFGMQGVKVSLEHDFGCGAVDFRGAWRNSGA